jgi:hypothetical protein
MADFKYISVRKRTVVKSGIGNAPKVTPKAPEPTEEVKTEEQTPSAAPDQTVGE